MTLSNISEGTLTVIQIYVSKFKSGLKHVSDSLSSTLKRLTLSNYHYLLKQSLKYIPCLSSWWTLSGMILLLDLVRSWSFDFMPSSLDDFLQKYETGISTTIVVIKNLGKNSRIIGYRQRKKITLTKGDCVTCTIASTQSILDIFVHFFSCIIFDLIPCQYPSFFWNYDMFCV